MKFNKREILRAVALVAVVWVAFLLVLARWQRSTPAGRGQGEPELLRYPGTEGVTEQTATNLGFRKYWFTLNEEYPSKSVYYFYRNELGVRGWQPLEPSEPQWVRRKSGDETRDLFQAIWVGPDRLFEMHLEMMSVSRPANGKDASSGEERDPGIQVFVTLRRSLNPTTVLQPAPRREPEAIEPGGR